jgi:dUTPase
MMNIGRDHIMIPSFMRIKETIQMVIVSTEINSIGIDSRESTLVMNGFG